MEKVELIDELVLPRIVHGHWRLKDWGLTKEELLKFAEQLIDLGINAFDHADIYGNYECEKLFGEALSLKPSLRKGIKIITKCGIKLLSNKYPNRKVKHYDYTEEHIVFSVEKSLRNFNTDYIDLLLLHRPSPYLNPEEVANAFFKLKTEGKVLNFGVSNFNPLQFETLDDYFNNELVTNQVEISPYCLENFENGNMDFFLKGGIHPMAWSPLAGGRISNPSTPKEQKITNVLKEIAEEMNIPHLEQLAIVWLLNHPAKIIPILGTKNLERIEQILDVLHIKMSTEDWFRIYIAAKGEDLP